MFEIIDSCSAKIIIRSALGQAVTVIGPAVPAVNIASRLKKLTKTTKKPVLLSAHFVEAVEKDARMEGLGSFELPGVAKAIEVFTFS